MINELSRRSEFCSYLIGCDRPAGARLVMELDDNNQYKSLPVELESEMRLFIESRYPPSSKVVPPPPKRVGQSMEVNKSKDEFVADIINDVIVLANSGLRHAAKDKLKTGLAALNMRLEDVNITLLDDLPDYLRTNKRGSSFSRAAVEHEINTAVQDPAFSMKDLIEHEQSIVTRRDLIMKAVQDNRYDELCNCLHAAMDSNTHKFVGNTITE